MKVTVLLLLTAFVMIAACEPADTGKIDQTSPEDRDSIAAVEPADTLTKEETRAKNLVDKAVKLMLAEGQTPDGQKAVFLRFENPDGGFIDGEYYLFIYDLSGTVLAHGAQPDIIGKNLIDKTDANGVKMIADMVRIAKEKGSGWIDYLWPYPGTGEIRAKRAWIARPGQMDMFIGCGFYPPMDHE